MAPAEAWALQAQGHGVIVEQGRYSRIAEIRDLEVAAAILSWLGLRDAPLPITPA